MNHSLFRFLFSMSHRNFLFDEVIVAIAKYLPVLLVVGALIYAFHEKDWKRNLRVFSEGALALILARGIVAEVIHFFYAHPRPFELISTPPLLAGVTGSSFPSGHAAFLFALGTTIFYFNRKWGWIYLGCALINGVARIAAGVHWPFDIVGGMAVGILSAMAVHALLPSLHPEEADQPRTPAVI